MSRENHEGNKKIFAKKTGIEAEIVIFDLVRSGFEPLCKILITIDQNHVALKVVASEKEHPLITTNPAERILI